MTHAILISTKMAAKNIDAYNRSAICAADVDNGWLVYLDGIYDPSVDGYDEVFHAKAPASGSLTNLWMAVSPENVLTDSKYLGLDPDVRNFTNSASKVFDVKYLHPGDQFEISAQGLTGTAESAFAVAQATSGCGKWLWSAAPSGSLTSAKYLATNYISIGTGSAIGSQRVSSYLFEVLYNSTVVA